MLSWIPHKSARTDILQHTIHSNGDIRFALTGRHVIPEMITDPVLRKGGHFDWKPEREYHGDVGINAQTRAVKKQERKRLIDELEFTDSE